MKPEQDILKGIALAGDCNPRRMHQLPDLGRYQARTGVGMTEYPELREALLRRIATDLRVIASDEHTQRPADMECCWVTFERPWPPVPGRTTTYAHAVCRQDCQQGCHHQHHKGDIFLAGWNS